MRVWGFYHVCQINHWREIVEEQRDLIVNSGLYDKAEGIYVVALGETQEVANLKALLKSYPKFVVSYHSENIQEYEFATMKLIKAISENDDFYGFYVHTKGVTWSSTKPRAYAGGTFWRQFMNYHTIFRWRDNITLLDAGYDTVGTQIRTEGTPPAHKLHYSGTFCWFKSYYIKKLKPVDAFDLTNRFDAEIYICSGHPIAATLSQKWVDYNTAKWDEKEEKKAEEKVEKIIEVYKTESEIFKVGDFVVVKTDERYNDLRKLFGDEKRKVIQVKDVDNEKQIVSVEGLKSVFYSPSLNMV